MATAAAPKTIPKGNSKTDAKEATIITAKDSNKKRFLVIGAAAVTILGGGIAATWYFTGRSSEHGNEHKVAKAEPAKPPIFVNLEPFTVNLQPEIGDQYLQITLTLQVKEESQVELIKLQMPQVRSRLLMLLSSKKASEISTLEGKKKLSDEIIAQVNLPFTAQAVPQSVSGVFFTSFIIQ
jgi:flagellar protein FliL